MLVSPKKIQFDDLNQAKLKQIEVSKWFSLDQNIHKYTKQLGQICQNTFMALDETYQLAPKADFEVVCAEILKFSANDPSVRAVLDSIKRSGSALEGETKLNPQMLLCKVWSLSKSRFAGASPQDTIIDNLKHNAATGGGCLAGICARLIQPYTFLITNILEGTLYADFVLMKDTAQGLLWDTDATEDEAYTHALIQSVSRQPSTQSQKQDFVVEDASDDEFEQILAMSKYHF